MPAPLPPTSSLVEARRVPALPPQRLVDHAQKLGRPHRLAQAGAQADCSATARRTSCLMLVRNSLLARLAASAASLARRSSWWARQRLTNWASCATPRSFGQGRDQDAGLVVAGDQRLAVGRE